MTELCKNVLPIQKIHLKGQDLICFDIIPECIVSQTALVS